MTNTFYAAPPRTGKSYIATALALDRLSSGRPVFSNFPVVSGSLSSYVWRPEYVSENIQDSLVIIDEAQRDFDSLSHKSLTDAEDYFFAASGHNRNDVIVLSQNPARVAKAVRDRMNYFAWVRTRLSVIFLRNREGKLGRPLLLSADVYLDFESMMARRTDALAFRDWYWFRRRVAEAYNTHAFGKAQEPFYSQKWSDLLSDGVDDVKTKCVLDIPR